MTAVLRVLFAEVHLELRWTAVYTRPYMTSSEDVHEPAPRRDYCYNLSLVAQKIAVCCGNQIMLLGIVIET